MSETSPRARRYLRSSPRLPPAPTWIGRAIWTWPSVQRVNPMNSGPEARRIAWIKPPTKIKNTSFDGDVSTKWFDGTLNASVSCLDQHLADRGDQVAIIWEGDDPQLSDTVTYSDLHQRVCRLANAMKDIGVARATA